LHLDAVPVIRILGLLPLALSVVGFAALRPRRLPSTSRRRGHPRVHSDASVLLIALLARPWRLSIREVCLWLGRWPTPAAACGLPAERVIDPAHLTRHIKALGPDPFWLLDRALVWRGLRGAGGPQGAGHAQCTIPAAPPHARRPHSPAPLPHRTVDRTLCPR
jgi:hypothetical protein